MGFRCFFSGPTKKISLQNGEKTEKRNYASFLDKNAHVQLHLGFIHVHFFQNFFFLFFISWTLPSLPFFFHLDVACPCLFFFFFFFLLFFGQGCPVFLFFCVFFWFRCDFFYGHDFYFLINLGNWFFWLLITFLVLIGHHFLIRVYA